MAARLSGGQGQPLGAEGDGLDIVHVQGAECGEGVGQGRRDGLVFLRGRRVVRTGGADRPVDQFPDEHFQFTPAQVPLLRAERDQ